MEEESFECECHSDEHQFKFALDQEDNELFLSVYLHNWKPWWRRVWVAVRYILGHTSKYGHWDSVIVQQKDAGRLYSMLNRYINPGPAPKRHYLTVSSSLDGPQLQKLLQNNNISVDSIETRTRK